MAPATRLQVFQPGEKEMKLFILSTASNSQHWKHFVYVIVQV